MMNNKATIFSLFFTTVLTVFLFFGWGPNSLPKEFLQYYKHLAQNDNHYNFANHEYGYNYMTSAELNSIFMTEGGDNQVFSLLYFATAERRRPDIDFFDQKGNVFPRLYGDLLNTFPDELGLLRDIRDYQLYSTDRPIYLTWNRPGLEKLNINNFRKKKREILAKAHPARRAGIENRFRLGSIDELKSTARNMVGKSIFDLHLRSGANLADQDFRYLGPWYIKKLGMVSRVTPIRYAIVDGLEASNGVGRYEGSAHYVNLVSKINISQVEFDFYVNELVNEGYVERLPNSPLIKLVKPFRVFKNLESIDYWKYYRFSHTNVANANSWDFLTREIFGNYIRKQSDAYKALSVLYRNKANFTQNPNLKQEYLAESKRANEMALKVFGEGAIYNYDNPYMMFNYGKQLYVSGNKELAPRYLAESSRYDYKFVSGYLDAIRSILGLMQGRQPKEKVDVWKEEARGYLVKFYEAKELLYSSTGNPQGFQTDKEVVQAKALENQLNNVGVVPQKKIQEVAQTAVASGDVDKVKQLIEVYKQQGDKKKVLEQYDTLINLQPKKFENYTAKYEYTIKNGILDQSINVIQTVLQKYNELEGNKPPAWSLYYNLGRLYFDFGSNLRNNNQVDQSRKLFLESKKLFNLFIQEGLKNPNDQVTKKRVADANRVVKQIDDLIK